VLVVLRALAGVFDLRQVYSRDILFDAAGAVYGTFTDSGVLFAEHEIQEFFFGWEDAILSIASKFPLKHPFSPMFPGLLGNTSSPNATLTQVGISVQLTGANDLSDARQFVQWNGMQHLRCCETGPCGSESTAGQASFPTWVTPEANDISHGAGTYGTQFSPFGSLSSNESLPIWVDVLYRPTVVAPLEQVSIKGIPCLRYVIPPSELANTTYNPDNHQWRMFGIPTGTLNISACSGQVPVLVSKPHFLDADPALATTYNLDNGPAVPLDRAHLDTYIDVEPTTGTTMQVQERLQVNMLIGPFGSHLPDVPTMVYPLGWLEKRGVVTDSQAAQWHGSVGLALQATQVVYTVGAVLGSLSAISLGLLMISACRKREEPPPLDQSDGDDYMSI
jgi:hypothetical protein